MEPFFSRCDIILDAKTDMVMMDSSRHAFMVSFVVFYTSVVHSVGQPITIAVLIPADENRLFAIGRVEPALAIAVEQISAERPLLNNRHLTVQYADSKCSIADGINEAINFYVKGEVSVYFGPCCDYAAAPVARQIKYWNIPMITPGALACDFAKKKDIFSLTTRLGPTFNSLVYFFVHLLQYNNWRKLKIIYDPNGHDEIIQQYCHIFADGLHNGLRLQRTIQNLSQEYFKFNLLSDMTENFEEHIGNKFASKIS